MDRTGLPALAQRLRRELFASRTDGLITLVLLGALVALGGGFLRWALVQAQWAVVQANSTLFAVGRYPLDQQWRLWLLTTLLAAATGLSWGLLRGRSWPRNDTIAALLLAGLGQHGHGMLTLDVPEDHAAAVRLALGLGMAKGFETARMYAGPVPVMAREKIFGVTSFELG